MTQPKKFITFLLAATLLSSYTSPTQTQVTDADPRYMALTFSGLALVGAGAFWVAKNPMKKKEGITKRGVRTICGGALILSGLGLIFTSKTLLEDMDANKLLPKIDTFVKTYLHCNLNFFNPQS